MLYDPLTDIDPETWLAANEHERIDAVYNYHRRRRIRLPNPDLHAALHVMVENHVALGDSYPAKAVLDRLIREGLDRHEAVHAIASVLSEEIFDALKNRGATDLNTSYMDKLARLTAESWRKSFSES
jgi:hypothetical protein